VKEIDSSFINAVSAFCIGISLIFMFNLSNTNLFINCQFFLYLESSEACFLANCFLESADCLLVVKGLPRSFVIRNDRFAYVAENMRDILPSLSIISSEGRLIQ